jgi:hypothetical protein
VKPVVAAVLALILSGCALDRVQPGSLTHESKVVELGKSEMARIELKMAAGELHLAGGSPKLVEADFLYNVPEWKPTVVTNSSSFRSDIKIEQSGSVSAAGDTQNKWVLKLNNAMPIDIVTHLGAGEARMDLGAMHLRSLRVDMGVGSLNLDLRGDLHGILSSDCNVQIHGGVGEAIILLPKAAGISAKAMGGIGDITVEGLEQREGRWINPARDPAAASIHIEIEGGVGNIRLVAD